MANQIKIVGFDEDFATLAGIAAGEIEATVVQDPFAYGYKSVEALAASFDAEREIVIARELTKRFESIHRCRLGDAPSWLRDDADRLRGEFVLLVDAPASARTDISETAQDHVLEVLLSELPLAQAVRLAVALTGAARNVLYARALALSQRESR